MFRLLMSSKKKCKLSREPKLLSRKPRLSTEFLTFEEFYWGFRQFFQNCFKFSGYSNSVPATKCTKKPEIFLFVSKWQNLIDSSQLGLLCIFLGKLFLNLEKVCIHASSNRLRLATFWQPAWRRWSNLGKFHKSNFKHTVQNWLVYV